MTTMLLQLVFHYGNLKLVDRWLGAIRQSVLKYYANFLSPTISTDDKELVNGSVLVLENVDHLIRHLGSQQDLDALREQALSRYVDLNLPKVFGDRLYSYLHKFLALHGQDGKAVAFKPDYGRAAMRKSLQSQSAKDTRNGVAYVQGRVQKHFARWEQVWADVETEMRRRVERLKVAIGEVYGEELAGECQCLDIVY
jgi:hypothetical protein